MASVVEGGAGLRRTATERQASTTLMSADAAQCRRCLGQQNHSHSTYPSTYPRQQTLITWG